MFITFFTEIFPSQDGRVSSLLRFSRNCCSGQLSLAVKIYLDLQPIMGFPFSNFSFPPIVVVRERYMAVYHTEWENQAKSGLGLVAKRGSIKGIVWHYSKFLLTCTVTALCHLCVYANIYMYDIILGRILVCYWSVDWEDVTGTLSMSSSDRWTLIRDWLAAAGLLLTNHTPLFWQWHAILSSNIFFYAHKCRKVSYGYTLEMHMH